MKLSSNLADHTPHSSSYFPTFVTTGRYNRTKTLPKGNPRILQSSYWFIECLFSEIGWVFTEWYSKYSPTHTRLVFNDLLQRILHLTIQSLITLHLNALDLSSLVRILRLYHPRNAEDAVQTDGLAKIHRPMTWLILLVFRQISSAVLWSTT